MYFALVWTLLDSFHLHCSVKAADRRASNLRRSQGTAGEEEVRRWESEAFQGLPSRPARPLAAAGRCCFARGLWEVLLLGGQAGAPPSSCFDRHRAIARPPARSLAHSHRRFPCSARHCGFSRKREGKERGREKKKNRASPQKVQHWRSFMQRSRIGFVALGIDPRGSLHGRL